jgi:hypothetical protein
MPAPEPERSASAVHVAEARPVYDVTSGAGVDTVVVYCSDPRFQAAFEGFLWNELHLGTGSYIPIVVAGGAGALARPHELPKEFKFMKERLELARDNFSSIRRIILITHEDCRYYESMRNKVLGFLGPRLAGLIGPREDLPAVAGVFKNLLSGLGLSVELYYARFADEARTKITFEKAGA